MKWLLLSDTHIRSVTPVGRTDDILETLLRKLGFVASIAEEYKVDGIIQAGDLFDIPDPSLQLLSVIVSGFFAKLSMPFFTILGQHDQYMRSTNVDRTATGFLRNLGILQIVPETGILVGNTAIHGVSYGGSIENTKLATRRKTMESTRIIVIHDNIGDTPLYPGDAVKNHEKFLADWPGVDLILCGDYHYSYWAELGHRTIVNTGCLLRLARNERDMNAKPLLAIYDTIEHAITEAIEIPIQPAADVFLSKLDSPVVSQRMSEFIHRLKSSNRVGPSFRQNLLAYMDENKVKHSVRNLIEESFGGQDAR